MNRLAQEIPAQPGMSDTARTNQPNYTGDIVANFPLVADRAALRLSAFMDDEAGFVSIINLASLQALQRFIGRPVDPLRLRANLYVEGWPAWAEDALAGGAITIGQVRLKVAKTITRCVATHVDPTSGERDMELVRALFDGFGQAHCGVYASVSDGGRIAPGDLASLEPAR